MLMMTATLLMFLNLAARLQKTPVAVKVRAS